MLGINDIRYDLPKIKKAIVLAPHPDDETLGCGGTIVAYSEIMEFEVIVISNGEGVNIPEEDKGDLRIRELSEAMRVLGVKDITCLNIPDGKFHLHRDQLMKQFLELFLDKKPQLIFSPFLFDSHPDHRETALCCMEVLKLIDRAYVAFYEIYDPIHFNTLIDIGKTVEIKKQALKKYHYSMLKKEDIFIDAILALNRFRSLSTLRDSHYEAFWIVDRVPELSEVSEWCTHGFAALPPENKLFGVVTAVDTLISHLKEFEAEIEKKDIVIRELGAEIIKQRGSMKRLNTRIDDMEKSIFWKIAKNYHKLRDVFIPEGSGIRKFYDKILSHFK